MQSANGAAMMDVAVTFPRSLATVLVAAAAVVIFAASACTNADLVVGDDTATKFAGGGEPSLDGGPSPVNDAGGGFDAALDGFVPGEGCAVAAPPPPGWCDGGPVAVLYTFDGCTKGFMCGPVACTTAGGTCVPSAPGSCGAGNPGSATMYTCAPGTGCCLP